MRGIITEIREKSVLVSMSCRPACSSCAAREACGLSSRPRQIVEIKTKQTASYRVGQEVELEIDAASVRLSLLFAYVFPLVLVLGVMGVIALLGYDETICAAAGLFCLIPYYCLLRRLNPWLQKHVKIRIR